MVNVYVCEPQHAAYGTSAVNKQRVKAKITLHPTSHGVTTGVNAFLC